MKLTTKGTRLVRSEAENDETGSGSTGDDIEFQADHVAEAVKEYAAGLEAISLTVHGVTHLTRTQGRHIQIVEIETEESAVNLTEVPVDLRVTGGRMVRGKVVGQEPESSKLFISFHQRVPEDPSGAKLIIDRGYLLRELAVSLKEARRFPRLVEQIFRREATEAVVDRDSVEVADQLLELGRPWGRLLWGPPGAGKTYGVAHFVKELIQRDPGHSVLMVAPSNLAVDVALAELVDQFNAGHEHYSKLISNRRVTRYGYPRKQEILEHAELLGPPQLDRLNGKVKQLSEEIRKKERDQHASDEELATLRAQLLETQETIRERVREHLSDSWIVATTTTSAYMQSSPISELDWDTVILDEATMAPPALCVFLGSLAKEQFLVTGDPRQLGPIFESSASSSRTAQQWMGNDIFDFSGVSSGTGELREIDLDDSTLVQIRAQRRCTEGLWEKVQHLYPRVESEVDEVQRKELVDLPPQSGKPVVLLDTSNTAGMGRCRKEKGSWENEYTAGLAMEVASAIVGEAGTPAPSIAIISPYRAQTNLLREAIKKERQAESKIFDSVEVGTVHQFQGSEADVVIFDVVDGPGRSSPGVLLRGDTGIRLVNVAATRARGKLIVLANRPWFEERPHQVDNRLLWRLVTDRAPSEQMRVKPPSQDGRAVDPKLRQCESPIEKKLLHALQKIPELEDIEPQFVIKNGDQIVSRADFAFPDIKLAVYCDGARWHLRQGQWKRDWRTRNQLQELGWTFNVFPGSDINEDPDRCARQVLKTYRSCT
ncbi:AAA domain-containing protein [Salinibacter sp. 10B]|uniref:AAA domain-containing protein n=1 Tax=Salinibacter sp. 10B TaxID=1923971 RepID=UPI001C6120AF|nr:AAA domain-containing protein [Salinibacter sp. 10B]